MSVQNEREYLLSFCKLYESLDSAYAIADDSLNLLWANAAALSHYPILASADGLQTLLPGKHALLQEALAEGKNCTVTGQSNPFLGDLSLTLMPLILSGKTIGALLLINNSAGQFPHIENDQMPRVLSGFSKSFRSPLASIFSVLFHLSKVAESSDPSLIPYVEYLSSNCYKILRNTINITEISRMLSGSSEFEKKNVNVKSFFDEIFEVTGQLLDKIGVEFLASGISKNVFTAMDPDRIVCALLNLVSNAILSSPEEKYVRVTVDLHPTYFICRVSDHGRGIPADILPRVFEPYFSYHPDGPEFAGLGLGLSLVKHIISSHRGSITINSTPGEGTTVGFSLPLKEDFGIETYFRQPIPGFLRDRFSRVYVDLADVFPVSEELERDFW